VNGSMPAGLPDAGSSSERRPAGVAAGGQTGKGGNLNGLFVTGLVPLSSPLLHPAAAARFREIFSGLGIVGQPHRQRAPYWRWPWPPRCSGFWPTRWGASGSSWASMLGWPFPTTLAATASNLPQLILWALSCKGCSRPASLRAAMAYISEETPRQLAGSTMSIYVTGGVVGGFCGRFASGMIAARLGVGRLLCSRWGCATLPVRS